VLAAGKDPASITAGELGEGKPVTIGAQHADESEVGDLVEAISAAP